MYLKDTWRSYSPGVDSEGKILALFNAQGVRNVPTCVVHGGVGVDMAETGIGQQTEASKYAPHVRRKRVEIGLMGYRKSAQMEARPVHPMPKRHLERTGVECQSGGVVPAEATPTPSNGSMLPSTMSSTSGATAGTRRGKKRTASDVEAEGSCVPQAVGCRHMVHHRLVVAEICMYSTEFTCGKQWVNIVADSVVGKSLHNLLLQIYP